MTKSEVLAVCDDLMKLVSSGPAADQAKAKRAKVLLDSLGDITGLGPLARTELGAIRVKFEAHFKSAAGLHGVSKEKQRSALKTDIEVLKDRLQAELPVEANYGGERP